MKVSGILVLLILVLSLVSAGCTGTSPGAATPATTAGQTAAPDTGLAGQKAVARSIAASVDSGLSDLQSGLQDTSAKLSKTGLAGKEAEAALSDNLLKYPFAVSSFAISKDGVVASAVPENYAGSVGENQSWQPQVRHANEQKVPVVSDVFAMVEGFTGVSQSSPVFSPSGEYLGYNDITYEPRVFIARQIAGVTVPDGYDVWVAQADGTQIYDVNGEEIGKNIVTDPMYADPALHAVLVRIAADQNGTGTYSFYDRDWNRTITKIAAWETAGIGGTGWRVVVTKEAGIGEGGSIAPAAAATPAAPAGLATEARYADLTQFVENAAAYAKEHGKEAALKEFNDINGSFINGDLYIFAYDRNGTALALPYQQGVLGTDRSSVADPNGVLFIDRLKQVAADGGGPVSYIYANPADNYAEQFKLATVLPVDDTWFVGSGIYLPDVPATFNATERDALVLRVKEARQYAQEQGQATAVAAFNDRNGTFADGSRYIFAYGINGTTLAMPFQPETIGTDRTGFTDRYGVKVAAWEIAVAKSGGGFVYVDYYNPDTGKEGLKLCYVAPVDATWLVGSGIYTDRT